jgi:hypothetical protein
VDDSAAELAELRSRGVEIQEYDMPGLKTLDGVADVGFALTAWIVDPRRNALSIMQLKWPRRVLAFDECRQRWRLSSSRAKREPAGASGARSRSAAVGIAPCRS